MRLIIGREDGIHPTIFFFFSFIILAADTAHHHRWSVFPSSRLPVSPSADPDPTLHHGVTQITLVFFVAAALSVSMLGLLSLHLYLTATNQTTLESFQKGNFVRQTKSGWRQPTVVENIEEVFGKNRWRWLLPIGPGSQGNGYSFKVKYDAPIHDHDVPLLPPSASDAETIPF